MKKKLLVGLLAIPMLLVGCGHSNSVTTPIGNSTPIYPSSPSQPTYWICYYHVGKPTEYYVLSNEQVDNIGQVFFKFTNSINQGSVGWATNDQDAVQLFEIRGVDVSKAVAVKLKNGSYVKATAVGTKRP